MMALSLAGSLSLALGLIAFGLWLIVLGQRAGGPRWALVLSWLLGLELSLAGLGVASVVVHAVLVWGSAR